MADGTARAVVGAHEVTLLRNGRDLFPTMLDAIARARHSVALEMYWVANDAVGRAFRAALASAARRGADVRVIVDGFGSVGLPFGWFAPLVDAGGRVGVFHPLRLALDPRRPHTILARDHRKLLAVDRAEAFVGGINLCAQWAPSDKGGEDWRDTAVRIRGPELPAHLARLFDASWSHVMRRGDPTEAPVAWATEGGRVGVLANAPERRRGRKIRQAYLWGLRRAKTSIDITCAYFAPRRVFVRTLRGAVKRGVRVRLLLPLKSDLRVADLLASSWVRALDSAGVEVYGYAGSILHAKTAVVDACWVTVGSHNLDALSWAYNLECNVFVDDRSFGAAAEAMFEDDLQRAVRLPAAVPSAVVGALSGVLGRALARLYELRR